MRAYRPDAPGSLKPAPTCTEPIVQAPAGRGTARRERRTPRPPRPWRGGRAGRGGRPASGRSGRRPAASRGRRGRTARGTARSRGRSPGPRAAARSAAGSPGSHAAGGDLAGDRAQGDRAAPARDPSTRVRPAPGRRSSPRRNVAQRLAARAQPRAPSGRRCGAGSRAARPLSISCLTTAQASASQGQGRRRGRRWGRRRSSGPSSGSRRKRAVELAEVVVDAEREAHPLDRQRKLGSPARRLGGGGIDARRAIAAGIDRLGPQHDPVAARLPGADQYRAPPDMQQTGGDPAADPHHPVLAAVGGQAEGRGRPTHLTSRPRHAAEQVDVDQEGAAGDDLG